MNISDFIMAIMPFVIILFIISCLLVFSLVAVTIFLSWLSFILVEDDEIQRHWISCARLLPICILFRLFYSNHPESDYCNFYFNTRWAYLLLIIMFSSSAISLYIDSFLGRYSFMIGYKNACYKIAFVCFIYLILLGLLGIIK